LGHRECQQPAQREYHLRWSNPAHTLSD
jgi:hypothetical protein